MGGSDGRGVEVLVEREDGTFVAGAIEGDQAVILIVDCGRVKMTDVDLFCCQSFRDISQHPRFVRQVDEDALGFTRCVVVVAQHIHCAKIIRRDEAENRYCAFKVTVDGDEIYSLPGEEFH